jgi:hypothetical protein
MRKKVGGLFHGNLDKLLLMVEKKIVFIAEERIGGLVMWSKNNDVKQAVFLKFYQQCRTIDRKVRVGVLRRIDYDEKNVGMQKPHIYTNKQYAKYMEHLLETKVDTGHHVISVWYTSTDGSFSDFQLGVTGNVESTDHGRTWIAMHREMAEETGITIFVHNKSEKCIFNKVEWNFFVQKL